MEWRNEKIGPVEIQKNEHLLKENMRNRIFVDSKILESKGWVNPGDMGPHMFPNNTHKNAFNQQMKPGSVRRL